jgi:phage terminase small subunit
MPILKNRRHETFAQQLAQGATAEAAYQAAGYKPDRGNASRLTANDSIRARVAELQEKISEAVIEKTAIDEARVIEELARIAFSDITKAVQWSQEQTETIDEDDDGGVTTIVRTIQNRVLVIPSDKIDADTAAVVASVTLTASGTLAVMMHDKIAALKALGDRFRPAEVAAGQINQNVEFIDGPPRETREQWIERQRLVAAGDGRVGAAMKKPSSRAASGAPQ